MSESAVGLSGIINLKDYTIKCVSKYEGRNGKIYHLGGYSETIIEKLNIKDGDKVDFVVGIYTDEPIYVDLYCPICSRFPHHEGNFSHEVSSEKTMEQIYFETKKKYTELSERELTLKCMDIYAKQEMWKILKEASKNLENHLYPGEEWYYKSKPDLYRNIILATEIRMT